MIHAETSDTPTSTSTVDFLLASIEENAAL
jgi:hypothetical protein